MINTQAIWRDLKSAIHGASEESSMSIDELKQRLATVPGIENLTMRQEGSNFVFSLGGPFVSVPIDAPEADVDAAIRALPPAPIVPPTVTLTGTAPLLAASPAVPTAPIAAHPSAAVLSVQDMLAAHMKTMADIHTTQLALLQASLTRQAATVSTAVGSMSSKIDAQTNDFVAMMGQFSNSIGGENQ